MIDTKIIKTVLNENPKAVHDYLNGNDLALSYLVGKVLKQHTNKTIAPQIIANKIKKYLKLTPT